MSRVANTNAEVIAEFRANRGAVAAPYDDPPPMLLLHTIGARSGQEHIVPMRCQPDGDTLYVFGSAHGSARHPDWYYNVIAHPDFVIEKGTETIPVRASELHGAEREAVFARQAARFPIFAEYEQRTGRKIPVIRLDRRAAEHEETMGTRRETADQDGEEWTPVNEKTSLIAQVERDVLSWPGVSKEFRPSAVGDATIYWLGKRQLGHIHGDGVADLQFPKAVHDELIASGRAKPHRGGFAAVVSYTMHGPEDVPGAVELFRLSYDRVSAATERSGRRSAA